MKKAVIVYYHPYAGSYGHAIMEAAQKGLQGAGYKVDLMDLGADNFNPVMSSADLLGFVKHQMVDPQALAYVERLKQADHLVLVFPIWWELMPAMVKGFIDKVIFPGSTYEYTHGGKGMRTLLTNLQSTTVITTMNTPKYLYSLVFGNAVQRALVLGTFRKSGLRHVKWVNLTGVKGKTNDRRAAWLTKIEQQMARK